MIFKRRVVMLISFLYLNAAARCSDLIHIVGRRILTNDATTRHP